MAHIFGRRWSGGYRGKYTYGDEGLCFLFAPICFFNDQFNILLYYIILYLNWKIDTIGSDRC